MNILLQYLTVFLSLPLLFLTLGGVQTAQASSYCSYDSTQARVQKDTSDPWKRSVSIKQGEYFNVGSFHDGIDRFASDTMIQIRYPDGSVREYGNGNRIQADQRGTYKVTVSTPGQDGSDCRATAYIYVSRAKNDSSRSDYWDRYYAACPYKNTQARVQKDSTHDWTSYTSITQGEYFNVGSFHDRTGQFAHDTTIIVSYPDGTERTFANGAQVLASQRGSYRITVLTNGYDHSRCDGRASVYAKKPKNITYYDNSSRDPDSCRDKIYAKVREDDSDRWRDSVVLKDGTEFTVTSLSKCSQQPVADVQVVVSGPDHYERTCTSGTSVQAPEPGTYKIKVYKKNAHGEYEYVDSAYVYVRKDAFHNESLSSRPEPSYLDRSYYVIVTGRERFEEYLNQGKS